MVNVDSTSCRAHQHAAEARRRMPRVPGKRRTPRQHRPDEGLGRSRGGPTYKIHVERAVSQLKNFRASATRFDKRACIFHGTVTIAAIWLWLRP